MLAAAARRAPALVWPRDVAADGALGRAFAARLEAFAGRARGEAAPAVAAARGVAEFAATAAASGHAAPIHIHI
jgi:hypothetical protein